MRIYQTSTRTYEASVEVWVGPYIMWDRVSTVMSEMNPEDDGQIGYDFFFDESQKTEYIVIDEDGRLNFDNDNDLRSFVGVFCGFEHDKIEHVRTFMKAIESEFKDDLNIDPEQELKSTTVKKDNFRFGFASLKRNNRTFYKNLFQLLSECKPILVTSFSNKYEVLVRRTIHLHEMEKAEEDEFYYSLSKFFSTYGPEDFFETMWKDQCIAISELSDRLEDLDFRDRDVERFEQRNIAFMEMAFILRNGCLTLTPVKRIHYPYILLPDALTLLLDEIHIPPKDISLFVDGEEGQYECFNNKPYSVLFVDSKEEPAIRICDQLAGLVARMCHALKCDPCRREPSIDADSTEKNRLRLLNPRWFKIDENTFSLYKSFHDALIKTNQNYWSTCTLSFHDDYAYLIAFLAYMDSMESFADYCKIDYKQRPRDFENWACGYIANVLEPPSKPASILQRYD